MKPARNSWINGCSSLQIARVPEAPSRSLRVRARKQTSDSSSLAVFISVGGRNDNLAGELIKDNIQSWESVDYLDLNLEKSKICKRERRTGYKCQKLPITRSQFAILHLFRLFIYYQDLFRTLLLMLNFVFSNLHRIKPAMRIKNFRYWYQNTVSEHAEFSHHFWPPKGDFF